MTATRVRLLTISVGKGKVVQPALMWWTGWTGDNMGGELTDCTVFSRLALDSRWVCAAADLPQVSPDPPGTSALRLVVRQGKAVKQLLCGGQGGQVN